MTGLPTCHLYSLLNSLDNAVHVSHLHISEVCPDRIFKTDLISENICSIKAEKLGKVIKNASGSGDLQSKVCATKSQPLPVPRYRIYSRRGKYSHYFRKTAGTKIEISTLRNIIETSGFFHCTHICSSNISEKRSFKIFHRFLDM
jgi:hypothetical protein